MRTDSRLFYLNELGLTLWQQRGLYAEYQGHTIRDEQTAAVVPESIINESAISEPDRVQAQVGLSETKPHTNPGVAETPAEPILEAVVPQAPEQTGIPVDDDTANLGWDELEALLASRDHRGAHRPVFGVGARDAPLLIVGEAPGAEEDKQGEPFVGRAGKLLDRMLFAIGHDRHSNTYITNICKFRPPDNRDPTAEEVAADRPILERQIALLKPRLIVAVGRIAAQTLLGSTENLGKLRGQRHRYPGMDVDVLVTYHPAYLLRSPQQKAKSWEDLKQIASLIQAQESI